MTVTSKVAAAPLAYKAGAHPDGHFLIHGIKQHGKHQAALSWRRLLVELKRVQR